MPASCATSSAVSDRLKMKSRSRDTPGTLGVRPSGQPAPTYNGELGGVSMLMPGDH